MASINMATVVYAKLLPTSSKPDKINQMFQSKTDHAFYFISNPKNDFDQYLALNLKDSSTDVEQFSCNEFLSASLLQSYAQLYATNGFDIDINSMLIGVIGEYNDAEQLDSECEEA